MKQASTIQVCDTQGNYHTVSSENLMAAASEYVIQSFSKGPAITSPAASGSYLQVLLGHLKSEVFSVLWLDSQHRVIQHEILFHGTINAASVYPREIVKQAIHHNAAAAILAHNHPSGVSTPSTSDLNLTNRIKDALQLIDVSVLDHLIIGETITSFAESGLL